jgi:hypothetical protein
MPTYLIRDAEGREVRRETTMLDILAPAVRDGETAELVQDGTAEQSAVAPEQPAEVPPDTEQK